MKLMIAKANRKNSGEIWEKHLGAWTGRVDISKEIIPGSRSSIHGYILTYSSLSRKKSPRAHLHMVGMLQFIPDINQPSLPTLFILFLCHYCLHGPFNCISFYNFSRQLSVLWLCSSGLTSALLVLSTINLFMKVSFSPDIITSGWLPQNTNQLTSFQ